MCFFLLVEGLTEETMNAKDRNEGKESCMLTRKMLSAMEIDADKIAQIIDGHTETVTGLQEEIDKAKAETEKYKSEASRAAELEKEVETLRKDAERAKNSQEEYNKLKEQFENYQAEQEKKEKDAVKTAKFRELLTDIGLSEKGIQMALKWQGVDGVELDDDGKITNAKELKKAAKEDWSEYITQTEEKGVETHNPPDNRGGATMTIEQIDAIEDATERQKAMLENHSLFGF